MKDAGGSRTACVCLSLLYHEQQVPVAPEPPGYASPLLSFLLRSSLLYLLPISSLPLWSLSLALSPTHTLFFNTNSPVGKLGLTLIDFPHHSDPPKQ